MIERNAKRDAAALRVTLDVAESAGIDKSQLLKDANLTIEHVYSAEAEIEVWQELSVIERLTETTNANFLAIEAGRSLHITTQGPLGYAMLCSSDIRSALDIAAKYHNMSLWLCEVATQRVGSDIEFKILPHELPSSCQAFCAIRGLASLKVWFSEMLGRDITPQSICLPSKQTKLGVFDDFFGREIETESTSYAISFAGELFTEPLKLADPWMKERTEKALNELKQKRRISTENQVCDLIVANPKVNQSETAIASALRVSSSTLRRRLKEEGTTFRAVRAEALHSLARVMLINSTMNIDEIAYKLGYAEAASFVRAFRRKEGSAPGVWRKAEIARVKS